MGIGPQGSYKEKPCFDIKEDDFLFSKLSSYKVQKFLGEGTYGKVAQCLNTDTMKQMAVKIVRKDFKWIGKNELAMFAQLKKLDQDKNNLVRFIEQFKHKGHVCLAFEMLDIDLFTFVEKRNFEPLQLCDIQSITQQMLVALNALNSIGVVHTDIKPDNIMLVDHKLHPLRAKLIDFGLACSVSELWCGCTIQGYAYRAPEVILGLRLNEAIDMWSLGCVLAFMYLGWNMYPSESEYDIMRFIVQIQGQPKNDLLESGIKTKKFFTKDPDSSWRLKTEDEYIRATDGYTKSRSVFPTCTSLDDILKIRPESINDGTGSKDRKAFSSLLKKMLNVDSKKRITPSKALQHSFISRKRFSHYSKPSQMEQSTNKVACEKNIFTTRLDDPPSTDDKRTAGTNYKTPAAVDSITGTTGKKSSKTLHIHVRPKRKTGEKPSRTCTKSLGMNRAVVPNVDTSTNQGTTGIVEVKTKKKFLMRMYTFFSKTMKFIGCSGRGNVIE